MEVTFLSSSGSFGGVGYNLSKVEKNAAELMEAANFDGLLLSSNPTVGDYVKYLQRWSEKNSRIKNSQFHVAISCRGREKSKEELLVVAKEWLKEMGYEGNPTLFIFHHDTDNNHIHIVTSRVDKDGHKINHNHERWRGRAALKRIEGIKLDKDHYALAVKEALTYTFANAKQFALILEQQNYKVTDIEGNIEVRKYGRLVATVSAEELASHIKQSKPIDTERVKQVKALLYKYKEKVSLDELKATMRKSFGLEMVFFGHTDKPYGYAIIDHKNKAVYKGSDIVPLKELLESPEERAEKSKQSYSKGCAILEGALEDRKATYAVIQSSLRRWGYRIKDSHLYHYSKDLGRLPEDLAKTIEYHRNLQKAHKIHTNDPRLLRAIASHYNVRSEDLQPSAAPRYVSTNGYHSLQELYDEARSQDDMYAFMKLNNAYLFYEGGQAYLIDNASGAISGVDTSNPERSLIRENNWEEKAPSENTGLSIDDVIDLFRDREEGGGVDSSLPKRRRR